MITCKELAVEKVEAELAEVDDLFKRARKIQVKRLRTIKTSCGAVSKEAKDEAVRLFVLKENHIRRVRNLRLLLAVLKDEANEKAKQAAVTGATEPNEEEG